MSDPRTSARASFVLSEVSGPRKVAIGVAMFASLFACQRALFPSDEKLHWFLMIPVGGLFLAIVAAQLAPLPMQLFARAMQWSNLGLGVALAILGSARERASGMMLTLACGTALLVIGDRGLTEAERRAGYMPAALKSSLLLLMVLALADAQSFALFGFARVADETGMLFGAVLLVASVMLVVGFVLLARLSLVGVVVDTLACALVILVSLVPRSGDSELRTVVGGLATLHLLVAIPTLVAASTGRSLVPLGPRARTIAARAVIVAGMVGAIVGYCVHGR